MTTVRLRRSIGTGRGCSADHPALICAAKPADGLIADGFVRVDSIEVRHPPCEGYAGML